MHIVLLFIALLPGIVLLVLFYRADRYEREPGKMIIRLFLLSAVITIPLALVFEGILSLFQPGGLIGIFFSAFLSAALVEEILKYWMVKKFAYGKPFFNEVMDGIVYAVTVSLGFATLENILYILPEGENGVALAIIRALTAVPGHALDGAILGYFMGIAKFSPSDKRKTELMRKGILLAILFHGLYDFFIFSGFLALLILPLLVIQFRYVLICIREAHEQSPREGLSLELRSLFSGLSLWDYVKWVFGMILFILSFIILFGLIGMAVGSESFSTGDYIGIGVPFLLSSFIMFLLFRSVWRKKSAILAHR